MKVEFAQALWRLGMLDVTEVEGIATQALLDGFDTPALRELAWRGSFSGSLWEQALLDLGQPRFSEHESAVRAFVEIARQVTTGDIKPYDGAVLLWRLGRDFDLPVFWGDFLVLSEEIENWEGISRDAELVNPDIVRHAHAVLHAMAALEPGLEGLR